MTCKALVIAAGIGVVAAATHANVLRAGGYASDEAPLIITMAVLLAVGFGYVGASFKDGQRLAAILLGTCILSGEAYWVLLNAEREIASREVLAAPLVAAAQARAAAVKRLQTAEDAKAAADAAVLARAAEDGCRKNCAALLLDAKEKAAGELLAARAALGQSPELLSVAPLPQRLGVPAWLWDLVMAGLRSLAIVGGSIAIGMAAHPRPRPTKRSTEPDRIEIVVPTGRKREHVAKFLRSALRPDPSSYASLRTLHAHYVRWCAEGAVEPLPPRDLGAELSAIIDVLGLRWERKGQDVIVHGAAIGD